MFDDNILNRANSIILRYNSLLEDKAHYNSQVIASSKKMEEILEEQELIEQSILVLQQVKPLLSASSIKQCENLANAAIKAVFDLDYTVEYSPESQRFLLNKGDYLTDLADAEGGGILTVVSAVYDLFLLIKSGARRVMFYDESWYAVSDKYFDNFINFMRQACKDLDIDLACVSHDARITEDMVDSVYRIENGTAIKLK